MQKASQGSEAAAAFGLLGLLGFLLLLLSLGSGLLREGWLRTSRDVLKGWSSLHWHSGGGWLHGHWRSTHWGLDKTGILRRRHKDTGAWLHWGNHWACGTSSCRSRSWGWYKDWRGAGDCSRLRGWHQNWLALASHDLWSACECSRLWCWNHNGLALASNALHERRRWQGGWWDWFSSHPSGGGHNCRGAHSHRRPHISSVRPTQTICITQHRTLQALPPASIWCCRHSHPWCGRRHHLSWHGRHRLRRRCGSHRMGAARSVEFTFWSNSFCLSQAAVPRCWAIKETNILDPLLDL